MRLEDLTGQRFGSLVVQHRCENIGNKTAWTCKCDCGNTHKVTSNNLKNGHVKSCGCKNQHKFKDLMGERFGKLVVINRAEDRKQPSGSTKTQWLCQCDCGNTCTVSTTDLKSGNTKSCGCIKIEYYENRTRDLSGQRFGNLIALERTEDYVEPNGKHLIQWLCKCDCGGVAIVTTGRLVSGHTRSCGCLTYKHGKAQSRLYNVWCTMKSRCFRDTSNRFKFYGARGITVCEEWKNDFQAFYDWAIQNGYDENAKYGECTLDRIDVNGNYEPSNCRWITIQEQQHNKR